MGNKLYSRLFNQLNNNGHVKTLTIISDNENIGKKYIFDGGVSNPKIKSLEQDSGMNKNLDFKLGRDGNIEPKYHKLFKHLIDHVDLERGTYSEIINGEEIFVEDISGKPNLIICGGGHIALPLSRMGKMLGFNVTIIDNRPEFANEERFKDVDKIICREFEEAIEEADIHSNTYIVIVTRGHKDDKKCLEKVIRTDNKYVGMIGSKGKIASVFNKMIEEGYSEGELQKVHSPIGLKIGAQTPEEIAVSIFAEIIEVKNKKLSFSIEDSIMSRILSEKEDMVLATIIDKKGSSPRGTGAKMLVLSDGTFVGTVGGGSVENAVYERAKELIKKEKSSIETYDLSNSKASKLGMACGGTIRVLLEYIGSNN